MVYFSNKYDGNLSLKLPDGQINRTRLFSKLNIKNVAFMNQVHGNKVKLAMPNIVQTCDALVTCEKNLALIVLVADCLPVLLKDTKTNAIAAIHSGRVGTYKNIIFETISFLNKNFNSNPTDIKAYLGACISQNCYEIDGEALSEAKKNFNNFLNNKNLDIRGIVKHQLTSLGVKTIFDNNICTKTSNNYFSYRKNQTKKRFAGIIMN